jgi:alkyl hydroperoxide reductase subunit AhpC
MAKLKLEFEATQHKGHRLSVDLVENHKRWSNDILEPGGRPKLSDDRHTDLMVSKLYGMPW